jgi:hypothetical protein
VPFAAASAGYKKKPPRVPPRAAMESLITLKQALDAGLITDSDYDAAKTAFLRAQQIRSGFESGLLSKADYDVVKASFLTSLGSADSVPTPLPPVSSAPPLRVPPPAAAAVRQPPQAVTAPSPAARPAAPPLASAAPPPPPPAAAPPPMRSSSTAPAAAAPTDTDGACCAGVRFLPARPAACPARRDAGRRAGRAARGHAGPVTARLTSLARAFPPPAAWVASNAHAPLARAHTFALAVLPSRAPHRNR